MLNFHSLYRATINFTTTTTAMNMATVEATGVTRLTAYLNSYAGFMLHGCLAPLLFRASHMPCRLTLQAVLVGFKSFGISFLKTTLFVLRFTIQTVVNV
jgi:ABC-type transport system involved in cytochrome bd biosynthesis fused ATPase/permease subunit